MILLVSQIKINGRRNGRKPLFYIVFLLQKRKNLTETGYGSPENAEQNYFAQFILIRNHFVVLWFGRLYPRK